MLTPISFGEVPPSHPIVTFSHYWHEHLDAGGFFQRTSWNPMECAPVLPWMILLEQCGEPEAPDYRVKIMGDELRWLLGPNLMGKKIGEFIFPDAAKSFKAEFQRCSDLNTPQYSTIQIPIEGRSFIKVCRGVFPVVAHGVGVDQFIAIVAKSEQVVSQTRGVTGFRPALADKTLGDKTLGS